MLKLLSAMLLGMQYLACGSTSANQADIPQLEKVIPLPGVKGRIDHLTFSPKQQIVFVAAHNNNSVEVIDLRNSKHLRSLKGFKEPQGIVYLPDNNTVLVTNGGNGTCNVFNAASFQPVGSVSLAADADNVRYDGVKKRIYVGYGQGAIAVLDAIHYRKIKEIPLQAHPEAFQLDAGAKKLFVNTPGARQIEVIDAANAVVMNRWKITGDNFPMALDTTQHRLLVGCRKPARLLVLDSRTGEQIQELTCDGDADDVFYNPVKLQVYVSCGSGYLDVFKQTSARHYEAVAKVPTRSGARTALFLPDLNRLLVAVPARSGKAAELWIFKLAD